MIGPGRSASELGLGATRPRMEVAMLYMTEQVLENGSWFVVLAAVLSFFWFHHRGKRHGAAPIKRS
jgi:hypothetical protein